VIETPLSDLKSTQDEPIETDDLSVMEDLHLNLMSRGGRHAAMVKDNLNLVNYFFASGLIFQKLNRYDLAFTSFSSVLKVPYVKFEEQRDLGVCSFGKMLLLSKLLAMRDPEGYSHRSSLKVEPNLNFISMSTLQKLKKNATPWI
jgi:hypothetical protein